MISSAMPSREPIHLDSFSTPLGIAEIVWYEEKNVDFAEAFHAAWMMTQGISVVHTFDRRHFGRFEHVEVDIPG